MASYLQRFRHLSPRLPGLRSGGSGRGIHVSSSAILPVRRFSSEAEAFWEVKAARSAIQQGRISEAEPLAMFWNPRMIQEIAQDVQDSFPRQGYLHTMAAKANPLLPLMEEARDYGLGCETASLGELTQALRAFPPAQVVFDSPTKTRAELQYALEHGVHITIDNFQELERLDGMLSEARKQELADRSRPPSVSIGIRINPEVGAGAIETHSTSVAWSKFGVPVDQYHDEIIQAYKDRPWMRMVHVHTGSQGCPLEQIAAGIRRAVDVALEVNRLSPPTPASGTDRSVFEGPFQQIYTLNMGGGFPVNFSTQEMRTMGGWAAQLREAVPEIFDGPARVFPHVISEYGRHYFAKSGFILSRVEYTKKAGGRHIALQHAGADLCVRTVYHPETWKLRITPLTSQGELLKTPEVETDLAGPCCIAGDVIASRRMLPELSPGDYVVVHDTGAYYHSSWSYYNSRQSPNLYFWDAAKDQHTLVKAGDSVEKTLEFFTP